MESTLSSKNAVTSVMRPLKRRRGRDRKWAARHKVSACTAVNFPWEVVMGFVSDHSRSVILMQMVSKGLRQTLLSDHFFWQRLYSRDFHVKAYLCQRVRDPRFPELKLWKVDLTSLARYIGPLHVDANSKEEILPPKEALTAYIRKWFALQHGPRCGVCGCRHRHEPYWSLGMRVCKLCMAENSLSAYEMSRDYGLEYTEVAARARHRIWYYSIPMGLGEDRVPFHSVHPSHFRAHTQTYMFWRPHLALHYNLPALKSSQRERRRAAEFLVARVRRKWLERVRVDLALHSRCSIDWFLIAAFRNEKTLLADPYRKPGMVGKAFGMDWAFPEQRKASRHTALTGESVEVVVGRLCTNEDSCVAVT